MLIEDDDEEAWNVFLNTVEVSVCIFVVVSYLVDGLSIIELVDEETISLLLEMIVVILVLIELVIDSIVEVALEL